MGNQSCRRDQWWWECDPQALKKPEGDGERVGMSAHKGLWRKLLRALWQFPCRAEHHYPESSKKKGRQGYAHTQCYFSFFSSSSSFVHFCQVLQGVLLVWIVFLCMVCWPGKSSRWQLQKVPPKRNKETRKTRFFVCSINEWSGLNLLIKSFPSGGRPG